MVCSDCLFYSEVGKQKSAPIKSIKQKKWENRWQTKAKTKKKTKQQANKQTNKTNETKIQKQ